MLQLRDAGRSAAKAVKLTAKCILALRRRQESKLSSYTELSSANTAETEFRREIPGMNQTHHAPISWPVPSALNADRGSVLVCERGHFRRNRYYVYDSGADGQRRAHVGCP
jgi:hypothetical protein